MPEFTAADGAVLHYDDEGEGLPLLCLSGLTRTGRDFDYLLPFLRPPQMAGLRVIRMDYRGRGRSAWTGAGSYTVPQEGQDALRLLDHLGIGRAAVLGTSRGGLIGLLLAAVAGDRLIGLCLNDIGPVIERAGLEAISGYVGRNPKWQGHEEAAAGMAALAPGFRDVPPARWRAEAELHYQAAPGGGLRITYDPALREAFLAGFDGPMPDLWPLYEALAGKPVGIIRGANSDLLSPATYAEMRRRRPDAIAAEVPGRAHIPYLDEPESLEVIRAFIAACREVAGAAPEPRETSGDKPGETSGDKPGDRAGQKADDKA